MQFTSKFILLAIALAYGSASVSAVPARQSSVEARGVEYAREIDDDMELFVRDPFSLFGFGTSSRARETPSQKNDEPHTGAALSRTKSVASSDASSVHETDPVVSKRAKKGRGAHYDPKPTMDVDSRRHFRTIAGQDSALLNKAAKDKNHAFHSTAIHMKQEAAVRKNPILFEQALSNPKHALHGAAHIVKAQNTRKATLKAALKDESHPLHEYAVSHRNAQHDKTIKDAQTKNPELVKAALANKNHKLHEAAHRVAAKDNMDGFNALPFGN